MNSLTVFFILLSFLLFGIITILLKRKIVIYNQETKEVVAVVGIKLNSKQIMKKELDFKIVNNTEEYIGNEKTGKVYLKE